MKVGNKNLLIWQFTTYRYKILVMGREPDTFFYRNLGDIYLN